MELKDYFVSYETAKKIKELGFDEPCLAWNDPFDDMIHLWRGKSLFACRNTMPPIKKESFTYPTYEQVFNWVRANFNLECHVHLFYYLIDDDAIENDIITDNTYSYEILDLNSNKYITQSVNFKTKTLAMAACVDAVIDQIHS